MKSKSENIDSYISDFPPATQVKLVEMRQSIRKAAPEAEECISYAMPAYRLGGMLVYFAGYGGHIGFIRARAALRNLRMSYRIINRQKALCSFRSTSRFR